MGLRISRDVVRGLREGWDGIDTSRPLALDTGRMARELAARLSARTGGEPLSAGRLRGTLELARVLRRILERYFDSRPQLLERMLAELTERSSAAEVREALTAFAREFLWDDRGIATASDAEMDLRPVLLEAILVWTVDSNPVAAPVGRALQGSVLWERPAWRRLIAELVHVLDHAPPLDRRAASLGASLRAVADAAPGSLAEQLRYLLDREDDLEAGERAGLLGSLDLMAEEEAPRFPPGPGPPELPDLQLLLDDGTPQFSADTDWMERLVLLAKNSYVWLHQLSREYGREIRRLDQIPDEELDRLGRRGITGLWLIGVWERSAASAEIKRRLGNPEARASAYSLKEYEIADDLGGEGALRELAWRAGQRGIRLASDMVPNHMGIDSRWLIDRPDLFLSVPTCPFPAYSFHGPDLSPEPGVGIYLEDHYYDRTDAAVVFKRVDRATGEERYVYHGNDGTSTPWNDTAQLDYLKPETRAAVKATILRVAELFPIIRFDAAMTLARRHVQRLWFPEPGRGGAIPSRSEHAMARHEFHQAMPTEFWREVVDEVNSERPNTLLLAEAFWLMEGYFVRSLGMHRVYNSAFMNLLQQGETAKLKRMIEETLAFDPEILKRHVNFLSNPDEEPAIEQFGSGDRYFGACVVMSTLPGLPMIAHGQLEGYREKYGMEFDRPRLEEEPDSHLVERHEREIFPLLRQRARFADVAGFRLLDLVDEGGHVNGNVLAFANGRGGDRSIVLFNNCPHRMGGTLPDAALVLGPEPGSVHRFRALASGLEYLVGEEALSGEGLAVDLAPYESRVLVDFRVPERVGERPYLELARRLDGRGVEDLELEVTALEWQPLLGALGALVEALERSGAEDEPAAGEAELAAARREVERCAAKLRPGLDREALAAGLARTEALGALHEAVARLPWPGSSRMQAARRRATGQLAPGGGAIGSLRALSALSAVRRAFGDQPRGEAARRALWQLGATRGGTLAAAAPEDEVRVLALALAEDWLSPPAVPGPEELAALLERWLEREDADRLLGLNRHDGEQWVNKELLELFLGWRGLTGLCGALTASAEEVEAAVVGLGWLDSLELARGLFERAGYTAGRAVERLKRRPRKAARTRPPDRGDAGAAGSAGGAARAKRARRSKKRPPNRSS